MTWESPRRPEWVRAVNSGLAGALAADAMRPLEPELLLGEARAQTGLRDLTEPSVPGVLDDDVTEPLGLLLADLEEYAALTVVGRWQTRRFLLRLLRVRLQLVDLVRRDPGVLDEPVTEPLFVVGAPRTGTSILHALLACDPGHRAPEGWELLLPVPPPPPDAQAFAADPRIAVADAELRVFDQVGGGSLDAIHVYGARLPKECLSAQSFAFRSQEFPARYQLPNYTPWLLEHADMAPAYALHKLVLQVLQRRFPADGRARWVLKSPVHLHSLDALLDTYPDARLVFTHRDPLTVLGSVTSLIANLHHVHSDDVDFAAIGRYHADLYQADLLGLVARDAAGRLPAGRVHHGRYTDFLDRPLPAVQEMYATFGQTCTPAALEAMSDYLDARPQDKHGTHHYSFADLGLDRDELVTRFAPYRDRFGV